mgnify:CR=1 FL=1
MRLNIHYGLLVLCSFATATIADSFNTGATLDPEVYMKVVKIPPLARGDYDELPNVVSLKNYVPPVGNQGSSGSCVGWSSVYAARTLAEQRRLNLSSPEQRLNSRFSPAYIYNQIRLNKQSCEDGSYVSAALTLMRDQGVLPLAQFPYSDEYCYRLPTPSEKQQAAAFRIDDFRRLGSRYHRSSLHLSTRKALHRGHPVVIGMLVGESFMQHEGSASVQFSSGDDLAYDNNSLQDYGGHAMTVIGYDDTKDGGAFEIMNSWGTDWGNKGFVWLKYHDYNRWVREAYELIPPPRIIPVPVVKKPQPNFTAEVRFIDFNGMELPLKQVGNNSQLVSGLGSGSRFRVELTMLDDSYLYILGADKASNDHVVLFPHGQSVSPYIGRGETMLLPGPTEDYFTQLNDVQGVDYFVVLMSRQPIDVTEVKRQLNSGKHLAIEQRLKAAIGEKLIAFGDVNHVSPAKLSAYLSNEHVLANIVQMNHGKRRALGKDNNAPKIVIVSPEEETTARHLENHNTNVRYVSGKEVILLGKAQDQSLIQSVVIKQAFEVKFSSRGAFRARIDISELVGNGRMIIDIDAIDAIGNRANKKIILVRTH